MDERNCTNTAFDLCPLSRLCIQAPREPAAFSKSTGCDSEIPHEKLTIAQARRGTPGHPSQYCFVFIDYCHVAQRLHIMSVPA